MRTFAVVLSVLLLTACGGGGDDDEGGTGSGGLPDCADVWVEGETLPEDYEGCMDGDMTVALVTSDCTDGSRLTGYDDRYWALLGGEIKDAGAEDATAADPEYGADLAACNA